MSHPFEKLFEKALKKSTLDENLVLEKALELRGKGYSFSEIQTVLHSLQKSLIDEKEEEIVMEALTSYNEEA